MAEDTKTRVEWDKRDSETTKAFTAFILYRDLPAARRSLREAAKLHYGECTTSRLRTMEQWSTDHGWVKRVEAWEREKDRTGRDATLEALAEMRKRHASIGKAIQGKAAAAMTKLDPLKLQPRDLLQYLVEGTKLERIAMGEPSEIVGHQEVVEVTWGDVDEDDEQDDDASPAS